LLLIASEFDLRIRWIALEDAAETDGWARTRHYLAERFPVGPLCGILPLILREHGLLSDLYPFKTISSTILKVQDHVI
jgi:hypothetical protein